ncbi:MAG: BspA family leucine-rich repeat surface protein [Lachnospiraceae bacterium]|nr:BspA family leucine-rich repeat surface protein [Lachnospiraceae bacterium]
MDGIGKKRYTQMRKDPKGFTLVELLVVLVIVAILAALITPAVFGFIDNARKKEVIARAETALSATQSALSDIYASNDNKYTPEKREQTRINAGAVSENTAFTVWNVRPLYDEPVEENPATVAIVEEIGSYTVGKAIYKDDASTFAAYDGTEWELYDSEEEARVALGIAEADPSVIYVWPFNGDTAYLPPTEPKPDPEKEGPEEGEVLVKHVTLLPDTNRTFFASSAESRENAREKIELNFQKQSNGNITADLVWTDLTFGKDPDKLFLTCQRTYMFRHWQEQGGDFTAENKNEIQNYIFSDERTDFTFIAKAIRDPNVKEQATVSRDRFRSICCSGSYIDQVVQIGTDTYADVKSLPGGAVRVDDEATEFSIYAWRDGNVLNWWTDALVAFMPADCSDMFDSGYKPSGVGSGQGSQLRSFSFSGFDTSKMENATRMFAFNKYLGSIDFGDEFIAPKLANLTEMFRDAIGFTGVLDLSGIQELAPQIDLTQTFRYVNNVSEIKFGDAFRKTRPTTLEGTFRENGALTKLNLSGWDVSGVSSCYMTFYFKYNAAGPHSKLETIDFGSGWDLASCSTMYGMFYGCEALKGQDMHELRTGNKLVNMGECFGECQSLTELDLNGIDASNVENFRSTFKRCLNLKILKMDSWKGAKRPGKVRMMRQTFSECGELLQLDLSGWDLSELENLCQTFNKCSKAEIILEGWNLNPPKGGKLYTVEEAFNLCAAMTGPVDLSGWDTTGLKGYRDDYTGQDIAISGDHSNGTQDAKGMFNGCSSLTGIDLSGWDLSQATNLGSFFSSCGSVERLDLSGWIVGAFPMGKDFLNGCKSNLVEVHLENARFNTLTHAGLFTNCSKLKYAYLQNFEAPLATSAEEMFKGCSVIEEVDLASADLHAVTNMKKMFSECKMLKRLNISSLNTSEVTDMSYLFNQCLVLESVNAAGLKTENVTDMNHMFSECYVLKTLDLSGFDTKNVTDMNYMFNKCYVLKTLDLSGFDTKKVTDMNHMFNECRELTGISLTPDKFDTAKVTNMRYMFYNCMRLTSLDVSGFNTANVTDLSYMFTYCQKIEQLDVSRFNTEKATTLTWMFGGCNSLESINVSGFKTPLVKDFGNMFNGCSSIRELDLSSFDVSHATWLKDVISNMGSLEQIDISGWKMTAMADKGVLYSSFLSGSKNSLKKVVMKNVDFAVMTSFDSMFKEYKALEEVDLSGAKGNKVTTMRWMFRGCPKLKKVDMGNAQFAVCTAMDGGLENCTLLETVNMSGIDMPELVDPSWLFHGSISLKEVDLSDLGMGKVTNITKMFLDCTSLTKVTLGKELNKEKISACKEMFNGCVNLVTIEVHKEYTDISAFNNDSVFKNCSNIQGGSGTGFINENGVYGRVDKDGQPGYFTLID